jgi:hypothetical protein
MPQKVISYQTKNLDLIGFLADIHRTKAIAIKGVGANTGNEI